MGTVSDKLTYLNTTKGKIKDSINLTGAGITNSTTFRNYATVLKDTLAHLLKNPSPIWNNFPKITQTGTAIQVNTYDSLLDYKLLGDTTQNGTPTPDAPVPINTVTGDQVVSVSNGTNTKSFEINLGKNLLDLTSFTTLTQSGITLTPTFDGSELLYITSSGTFSSTTYMLLTNTLTIQPNTTYTLSGGYSASARLRLREFDSNNTQLSEYFDQGSGVTFTSKSNVHSVNVQIVFYAQNNVKFYPMLEKGSTATTYAPYFTPIELCKIGTYQDKIYKDNGKWYLHKEVGKVVLNGSETWTTYSNLDYYRFDTTINNLLVNNNIPLTYSNYFGRLSQADRNNGTYENIYGWGGEHITINTKVASTIPNFTTWLGTHNTIVYYVLQYPTTTEITNEELISQLDSIELLDGLNNIAITGDLPAIMNLTCLEKE